MNEIHQAIKELQDANGWSDAVLLDLLIDYIEERDNGSPETVVDYLNAVEEPGE